jgi:hypothetical protein
MSPLFGRERGINHIQDKEKKNDPKGSFFRRKKNVQKWAGIA